MERKYRKRSNPDSPSDAKRSPCNIRLKCRGGKVDAVRVLELAVLWSALNLPAQSHRRFFGETNHVHIRHPDVPHNLVYVQIPSLPTQY
jgi:hypothetical protein